MVYGRYSRYNELVNGGFFMVYKPTNITEGPSVVCDFNHFMPSFRKVPELEIT
jgi:hypothetical protein